MESQPFGRGAIRIFLPASGCGRPPIRIKADDDCTTWANDVKKHFSGQVLIAKDLMEF